MRCEGARLKGVNKKSLSDKPLVTIITATYNVAQLLSCTIKSIREQTYGSIEWIVVDGASRDGTVELIRQNEDVIDYWVSEPDSGIYDAWNKGVSLANGEWIAFLGAGDVYLPQAVEQYADYIASNEGKHLDYISSRVDLDNLRLEHIQAIGTRWSWPEFRKKMNVAHVGSLHHRSLYERYGLYDTAYKIVGDYELLLRPRNSLRAGFFDSTTARMLSGGASSDMGRAFVEARRAKHVTGGRANILCMLDNAVDVTKIIIKKILFRKYRF